VFANIDTPWPNITIKLTIGKRGLPNSASQCVTAAHRGR
jgi:hypothetical protein